MRQMVEWVASKLSPPRVIQDGLGRSKYLIRWYLFGRGRPTMLDGTSPFDMWGNPKVGAVWPAVSWSIYLHRFHRGDVDRELHSHPWKWAVSLVLVGGYIEERRTVDGRIETKVIGPGSINRLRATDFHRVDLIDGEAWTLFLVGSREIPWREFLASKQVRHVP
jgi:hypothetical protein